MLHREGHCQTGSHTPGWNGVITGDTGGTDLDFGFLDWKMKHYGITKIQGEGSLF